MLIVNQEEPRASDTVLFTSENNDIANQNVDTSFFTSEKSRMTNQLASLARRDYFLSRCFLACKFRYVSGAIIGDGDRKRAPFLVLGLAQGRGRTLCDAWHFLCI